MIKEIKVQDLDTEKFIEGKVGEIQKTVGDGTAINALSGGVDSSVVTMPGHKALGSRLRTLFIQNGLMRGSKRAFGHQIEVRCWDSTDA